MAVDPTGQDLQHFLADDPGGPVVMLNLLRFKEDGGRESYEEYARRIVPFLDKLGATVLFVGDLSTTLVAPESHRWHTVLIVRYPSRQAFSSMVQPLTSTDDWRRRSEHGATQLAEPPKPRQLPAQVRSSRSAAGDVFDNPILVGTITLLIVVVAVYLSYIAENGLPFVRTYNINVDVQNGSELVKNADVRVGGARVGQVLKISPEPATNAWPHPFARLRNSRDVTQFMDHRPGAGDGHCRYGLQLVFLDRR